MLTLLDGAEVCADALRAFLNVKAAPLLFHCAEMERVGGRHTDTVKVRQLLMVLYCTVQAVWVVSEQ